MSKEKISLTKGELEGILAHAMGYVWNELSTDIVKVNNDMDEYNKIHNERAKITEYYFNLIFLNQNKDEHVR
jgi:hypothetical protein